MNGLKNYSIKMYLHNQIHQNLSPRMNNQNLLATIFGAFGGFLASVYQKIYLIQVPILMSRETLIRLLWSLLVAGLCSIVAKACADGYSYLLKPVTVKFYKWLKRRKFLIWIYKNK